MTAPTPYLDIDEYAALLGVQRSWVRDKVTAREIQFTKVGRHARFTEADRAANEAAWRTPVASARPTLAYSAPYVPARRRSA